MPSDVGSRRIHSQKPDHARHLRGPPQSPQRDRLLNAVQVKLFRHVALDETGANGVHSHAPRCELLGVGLGQTEDAALGRRVVCLGRR